MIVNPSCSWDSLEEKARQKPEAQAEAGNVHFGDLGFVCCMETGKQTCGRLLVFRRIEPPPVVFTLRGSFTVANQETSAARETSFANDSNGTLLSGIPKLSCPAPDD
jgi:hypothetical protein